MFFKNAPLFWALLLGHLLGDFYFQTEKMAADKQKYWPVLLKHCAGYGICVLACGWTLCGVPALRGAGIAALGHAVVDWLKFHCREQLQSCAPAQVFLADQLLHLTVLAAAALWAPTPLTAYVPMVLTALDCVYAPEALLRLSCLVLFLMRPSNILLKICNRKPSPAEAGQASTVEQDRGAGGVIGVLERLLTAVLFLLGQYGAISVIFAAKTLTRYNKITEQKNFGEYYLIGTLASLLLAILATMALFPPR